LRYWRLRPPPCRLLTAECCLDRNQRRPLCLSLPFLSEPLCAIAAHLSGQRVFLNGVSWPTNGTATLWGTTSNGLANLCVSDNSVWGGSWALRSVNGDTGNTWPDPNLSVSSLPKDVYEIHLTTAASGSLPSSGWLGRRMPQCRIALHLRVPFMERLRAGRTP